MMFIAGKKMHKNFLRKLTPPIPTIKHKVMQQFARPRMFEDNSNFILNSIDKPDSHFSGWSFIQKDDKPQD